MAKTDFCVEREFTKDSLDKKRTARSASKRNRTGKGAVRFPSDYLPREERKRLMNPDVLTHDLSKPIPYTDFKKLSDADKKTQLEIWGNVYGHSAVALSKVLGVSDYTVRAYLIKAGLIELFQNRYHDQSDRAKEKRKKQRERLAALTEERLTALAEASKFVPVTAADSASTDNPATDIPEPKNAVETILEPVPAMDACGLETQMRGSGDLVKMAMSAFLDQIDDTGAYAVSMTFTRL